MTIGYLSGIGNFGVFVAALIGVLRFRLFDGGLGKAMPLFVGMCSVHAITCMALWATDLGGTPLGQAGALANILGGWLVMACLFVLLMPFLFVVFTSLSIQSCVLAYREGGRIPLADLRARFASVETVERRLKTMVQGGCLT